MFAEFGMCDLYFMKNTGEFPYIHIVLYRLHRLLKQDAITEGYKWYGPLKCIIAGIEKEIFTDTDT